MVDAQIGEPLALPVPLLLEFALAIQEGGVLDVHAVAIALHDLFNPGLSQGFQEDLGPVAVHIAVLDGYEGRAHITALVGHADANVVAHAQAILHLVASAQSEVVRPVEVLDDLGDAAHGTDLLRRVLGHAEGALLDVGAGIASCELRAQLDLGLHQELLGYDDREGKTQRKQE